MLDFRSLQMVTVSLAVALDAAKTRPDGMFVRDASFQRFEYTYELCVKSLRRQLEAMSDSPADIDAVGYRLGVERGSITTETAWFGYRELRNMTSHVYDPAKASRDFAKLPAFLEDARSLLMRLLAAGG